MGTMSEGGQKVKLPVIRLIHSWDVIYSRVTKFTWLCCIFESCKESRSPKFLSQEKNYSYVRLFIRSDQISHSVVSDSLRPHELQHARPPCPSPIPGVHSDSCPSSPWCLISSSVHSLLLLPPIPPSIRVFFNESTLRVRWPKYWSFSFSISPSNEHPGLISPLEWTGWMSLQSKEL